jgi:hypothetical protein
MTLLCRRVYGKIGETLPKELKEELAKLKKRLA